MLIIIMIRELIIKNNGRHSTSNDLLYYAYRIKIRIKDEDPSLLLLLNKAITNNKM